MEGNVQHVGKQVSIFDGKNADDFWNGLLSSASACRSTASQSSKLYKARSGHQNWTTIR